MSETTICRLDELTDGEGRRFDVEGHRLAVIRIADAVYVIGDRCTHAEASLSEGEVDVATCHIECWRHGSSFSLITGHPDALPATRAVPVYEAHVRDGDVVVAIADAGADTNAGANA
ncbi:MAG: ferredoxin subunit of nitrite reductase and ring-hydroxylating dioxygenase [Acidimicrobiales bacterium]|nr:ferredoxin subunit of nitrite reductase and ring-hydroxylating dioxygenase [Acidimicrobiales bacterium]